MGKGENAGNFSTRSRPLFRARKLFEEKQQHTYSNKQTRLPGIDRIWFQKGGSVGPIVNRSTAIFCRNFPLVTPNIHRKIWKSGGRTVWEKNCIPSEKCSQIWRVSLWNFLICIWRYEHPGVFKGVIVWGGQLSGGQLSWAEFPITQNRAWITYKWNKTRTKWETLTWIHAQISPKNKRLHAR